MISWKLIAISCAIFAWANATEVDQCQGGPPKIDMEDIKLTKCNTPPCILRRKTTVGIQMKLKPEKEVQKLTTSVQGIIADVPLPFVGVDGTSACDNIFSEDGNTKLGCPLKAGETYLYKNSFPIYPIYPTVNVKIHWALKDQNNKDFVCFEVPARIK